MMEQPYFLLTLMAAIIFAFGYPRFLNATTPENLFREPLPVKKLPSESGMLLVDIRTPSEWQQTGVVKGSHLLTFQSPESFLNDIRPKLKNGQRLALICRSGNRSSRAARKIAKQVDFPVVDIEGGMARVLSERHKIVRPTRAMGCQNC